MSRYLHGRSGVIPKTWALRGRQTVLGFFFYYYLNLCICPKNEEIVPHACLLVTSPHGISLHHTALCRRLAWRRRSLHLRGVRCAPSSHLRALSFSLVHREPSRVSLKRSSEVKVRSDVQKAAPELAESPVSGVRPQPARGETSLSARRFRGGAVVPMWPCSPAPLPSIGDWWARCSRPWSSKDEAPHPVSCL